MTPEEIKKRAEEIEVLENRQNMFLRNDSIIVITKDKVYLESEHGITKELSTEHANLLKLVSTSIRQQVFEEIGKQIADLCKEPS